MFKYNNTHIFTGYLKQLMSSVNIPTCKVYTKEFAKYLEQNGKEDPRVLESYDSIDKDHLTVRVNYLKNNEIYNYFWNYDVSRFELSHSETSWKRTSNIFYNSDKAVPGLTKTLNSPGCYYDTLTHEYLGEYLRFLRDYYDLNLLSLYNCFNNKICNNIDARFAMNPKAEENSQIEVTFDSQNPKYQIYAIPVKLFANYTIAVDCAQGIEMFCGLYNTTLDKSARALELAAKTYKKIGKALFTQPFLYDKLDIKYWPFEADIIDTANGKQIRTNTFTRWDITNREQDLKLFIKIPTSCRSSIVILEGDFRYFNDSKYVPKTIEKNRPQETWIYKQNGKNIYVPKGAENASAQEAWTYKQNYSVLNFNTKKYEDNIDLNDTQFSPIGKLQLLAFNTGESYPFADRLIEYLSGSTITPLDPIPDNIKRVQRVMNQNQHYFRIDGLWENKMQKLIYDYIVNAGPVEINNEGFLVDKRRGYHRKLGHTNKSTLYDILGFIDKDAEKWYASWAQKDNKAIMQNNIQNIDIYDGLYDI